MPDIVYQFIERGKEGPKAGFREIGAEARNAKRDVDAAIKSIESLARVKAKAARAGTAAAGPGSSAAPQRQAAAGARETAAQFSRVARERASEDQKQAQLRAAREASERRQRDAEHRATLARTKQQGLAERDYWAERRRRQTQTFNEEERAGRRKKQLDDERKRFRERQFAELNIGGAIKGAVIGGSLAAGALGLGVTGAAARESLRLRELSNRISINSRLSGQAAIDPAVLQKEFENTAIRTPGQTAMGLAEALQGFVTKTGRADIGRQQLSAYATVASASGADVRDVAATAADLFQKFDITGLEDMRDALAALTFQGKEGAFELKDAATQFARMSAAASRFGIDKGVGGVKILGGLTQIARSATGSSEQASTAVEATLRQLIAKSGDIKKMGADVFVKGSKSKTRDVRDILVDVISKTKGSLPALQKIFGEEGIRGVSPLISTFNQAKEGAVGTEAQKTAAGIAALREQLRKAIDAPGDWSEVQKDAAQAQQDASAKLTASWERLQSKLGDALVPVITKFADAIANSPGALEAFVGTIAVLVEAMQGWLHIIELIMGIERKKLTPEQREQEQRNKVIDLDKQIAERQKAGKGADDPVIVELQRQRAQAARGVGEAQAERERVQDIQKIRTPEEFAAQYKALGGKDQDTRGLTGAFGANFADVIAQQIKAAPFSAAAAKGDMQIAGETPQQRELRLQQGQAARETKTQTLGVTGDDQVGAARAGLAGFIADLKAAGSGLRTIAAQGQPSPVGT